MAGALAALSVGLFLIGCRSVRISSVELERNDGRRRRPGSLWLPCRVGPSHRRRPQITNFIFASLLTAFAYGCSRYQHRYRRPAMDLLATRRLARRASP